MRVKRHITDPNAHGGSGADQVYFEGEWRRKMGRVRGGWMDGTDGDDVKIGRGRMMMFAGWLEVAFESHTGQRSLVDHISSCVCMSTNCL
jgi:hypothetical protein